MKSLIIFGTAEIAELAYFYFTNDSDYEVVAFTVDDEFVDNDMLLGLPVISFSEISYKFPARRERYACSAFLYKAKSTTARKIWASKGF